MKRRFGSALLGLAMACSLVAPSAANAQSVKERTIKFAFANTQDSAHGVGAQKFADMVAQKSGGKLKVKLYAGGTLGGEVAVASSLQGGTIEMSMMGPGLLTGMDKEFGVFDMPQQPGVTPHTDRYFDLMDNIVKTLATALGAAK